MRKSKSPLRVLLRASAAVALRDLGPLSPNRDPDLRHAAAGRRLAAALGGLRGLYTKLGQQLAWRADLLPDAMRSDLGELVDAAPPAPFDQVLRQIERSLGTTRRFAWIDPEPLGTASIAQVHRARLRSGPVVAIKVRHAELTPQRLEQDLATLRRTLALAGRWLPALRSPGLVEDLDAALRQEMDLEREGRTAERLASHLADLPDVTVPRVHWEATGPGVLTLDWVPGIRLDDLDGMEARGIDRAWCAQRIAEAYGRQVFGRGLFHADPHPGNLMLEDAAALGRDDADPARPRILFLDFGLAQQLPEGLREELRTGMQALLKRDVDGILAALERVGALVPGHEDEARSALVQALDAGAAGALGADAGGIRELKELGKRLVRESGAFRVPRELLLWARTLAWVLDLHERLAPDEDAMRTLLPHALRFLTTPAVAS